MKSGEKSEGNRIRPTNSFIEFRKEEIEQSIPERFEKTVSSYPDRVAVKTHGATLSYAELNNVANHIAQRVLTEAEEGNIPVAMLLEHGASGLAGILGILKAGKIYVPLDPSYPASRLRYMLRDARTRLIVTNDTNFPLADEIAERHIRIINIDEIPATSHAPNLGLSLSPSLFAYILYTSGSTGQPKGVAESHRNVLHGTLRFTNGLHFSADDRLSFTHSFSSSASVRRIFPALLNGAALFPLDEKTAGMQGLVNLLKREEITYCSLGRGIRDFVHTMNDKQTFDSIRLVCFGGDTVYRRDVELCRQIFPPDCLVGVWMSTTETGNITQYFIGRETVLSGDVVPIGYPAPDMKVLLLDDSGKQVGPGEIGEIAVQSRYLTAGYWQRPELNAAKFFPDPEGGDERIYLTGDLGRMAQDGCFFHLGRKDDQVKIRGYRVELAEVEAVLLNLPAVKNAFVTARETSPGNNRLIAYVIPDTKPVPTTSALRRILSSRLPDYMIPSVFMFLDAFPLTPTGKVDRKTLPPPDNSRPTLDTAFVKPRNSLEHELAEIWSEVLSVDQVGIHDNFFELGGHSLAATRVLSRVIEGFGIDVSLQSLFQAPTVAEMTKLIAENREKTTSEHELGSILAELDSLSEEEAQRLVSSRSQSTRKN